MKDPVRLNFNQLLVLCVRNSRRLVIDQGKEFGSNIWLSFINVPVFTNYMLLRDDAMVDWGSLYSFLTELPRGSFSLVIDNSELKLLTKSPVSGDDELILSGRVPSSMGLLKMAASN